MFVYAKLAKIIFCVELVELLEKIKIVKPIPCTGNDARGFCGNSFGLMEIFP